MRKNSYTPVVMAAAVTMVTTSLSAAATYTGANGGEWGTAGNWSGGVPNAVGAVADINTALLVNVSDTGTGGTYPYTFGTLATNIASGSVTIGSTAVTTDVLTAAVASGSPTINVATNGANVYMYATLQGTQGLTKTGAGTLQFRFNPAAQLYSGAVSIQGGVLTINQDSSLGHVDNDVTIANGARLSFSPGNNTDAVTLGTGREFTLTGAQSQIGSTAAAIVGTIQGSVSGAGGLTKVDAGRVNLNGSVTYQGDTRVVGGLLDFNSGTFSTTANVLVNGAAGTNLDLSDLTSFTMNGATKTFVAQPATTSSGTHTVEAILSKTANQITALTVTAGGASGTSQGSSNTGAIRLGTTNTINADTINVGGFNGRGEITLQAGLTAPTVTLRGTSGGSTRVANVNIGSTSSGTRTGEGVMTLTGSTVDARVGTMTIGTHAAGAPNSSTSSFGFSAGTVDILSLVLGNKTALDAPTINADFNQGGGTAAIKTLTFGQESGAGALPVFNSRYNLAAGTLAAETIQAGTGTFGTSSVRRIGWTGGTITHYDAATDLNISGVAGTGGTLLLALSSATTKSFDVGTGRKITVGANTNMTGAGVTLTKTGAGTLVLNSTVQPNVDVTQGVLGGNGTLSGSIIVAGGATVAPGNSIGNLAVGSAEIDGTLQIEWQDLGAGTADGSIDMLNVTNALDISAASLALVDVGPASDANDDAYVLASYGSLVGTQFSSVSGLPDGYKLDYAYEGNNIAVVPIPEPGSLAALALGALSLVRRRRS